MKRLIILLGILMLAACGPDEAEEDDNNLIDEELAESTENEPTQEELDAQLKEEAIEADFVAINGDEVADGTKLYADGTVDIILEKGVIDKFSFSTDDGIYTIISLDTDTEVTEGDFVRVYGTYAGKEEGTGIPILSVTVIEPGEKQGLADKDEQEEDTSEYTSDESEKPDLKTEAEANAAEHPATPGKKLFDEEFKGMNYHFKGELVKTELVEGLFGEMTDAFLVKNENDFVLVIFPPYEIEANVGDEIEAWGPLSGDGYASSDLGVDNVVGVTGAMNASLISVNGEQQ